MAGLKNYFGIDFGTTNSATIGILQSEQGSKVITYGDQYENPFPSVIVIDSKTGDSYCGREAWEKRRELSETHVVIPSIKTFLGTDKTWNINGEIWTPEMIASQILLGLKKRVKEKQGFDMDEAVMSIPVGFPVEKRNSLRKAATFAGIHIKSFISESTSAVFKNYQSIRHFSKIAVFDWGGGTLDISILQNKSGKIYELGVNGLDLGGDNIDIKLANWVHSKVMKQKGKKIGFQDMEPKYQDLMLVRAEKSKKALGESDSTAITISNYGDYGAVRIPVDIDSFSLLIEPEINQAIECLENTVKQVGLSLEEIECILMIGGSSNLRPLIEKIEDRWGNLEIVYPERAEWNVAEGAAMLSINPGSFMVNQNIGILLSDDTVYTVIEKDNKIPCAMDPLTFGIVEDSRDARFMFVDSDTGKSLGNISVPAYGFFKEKFILKSSIDENLVFRAEIKSDRRPEEFKRICEFAKLKFYFELPDMIRR